MMSAARRGSPSRRQPDAEQLALEVVERAVERSLRSVLTGDLCEPKADLLQRERIVTHERPVSFDERGRRLWGLVIAIDRRCLPSADLPSVMQLDVDDVFPVPCLARDHERLRQVKANGRASIRTPADYFAAISSTQRAGPDW